MKNFIMLIISILIIGCKNELKNSYEIDDSLIRVMDQYIAENPIKINYSENLKNFYNDGYAHPSYHIYFSKEDKDTLVSIVLFPELHKFDLEPKQDKVKSELIYNEIEPKGFFTYKKKYPIIVFDKNSIGDNFYKETILHTIPDTLIATNLDNIRDYKGVIRKYIIKNGIVTSK